MASTRRPGSPTCWAASPITPSQGSISCCRGIGKAPVKQSPPDRQLTAALAGCLRIFQMKGQFLVTELALLLQQRAAQHRFRRQSAPPGLAHTFAPQIARHHAHQRALAIQPARDCLQLAADLVSSKDLEYRGLDGAFLTHCRAPAVRTGFGFSGLNQSLPENRRAKDPILLMILAAYVYGRTLG